MELYEILYLSNEREGNPHRDTSVEPLFKILDHKADSKASITKFTTLKKALDYVKEMQEGKSPTPERIWQIITGFQMTAAMKAAIELGVFTHIADGQKTTAAIGAATGSAERGIRILCDTLSVLGFLIKNGNEYSLADDAAHQQILHLPCCRRIQAG